MHVEPDATWVIPTEDEWYKAAYHKNDGPSANYWTYATASDAIPDNDLLDPDPGNTVNYHGLGYTLGAPYWRTEVGEFENSASAYGTFDQSGNVWEWNETITFHPNRGLLGGGSRSGVEWIRADGRSDSDPAYSDGPIGLRLALVPEPTVFVSLLFALVLHRRNERSSAPRR